MEKDPQFVFDCNNTGFQVTGCQVQKVMTQKDDLIAKMKEEARGTQFENMLAVLDSIPGLKSEKKRNTLSFYKGKKIVAALRTHTLAHKGKFVLSVPERLSNECPQALQRGRSPY